MELPSLTAPVAGGELVFRGLAVVASAEVRATAGVALLDRHVRVAKHDGLLLTALAGRDHALLPAVPRLALTDGAWAVARCTLLCHAALSGEAVGRRSARVDL